MHQTSWALMPAHGLALSKSSALFGLLLRRWTSLSLLVFVFLCRYSSGTPLGSKLLKLSPEVSSAHALLRHVSDRTAMERPKGHPGFCWLSTTLNTHQWSEFLTRSFLRCGYCLLHREVCLVLEEQSTEQSVRPTCGSCSWLLPAWQRWGHPKLFGLGSPEGRLDQLVALECMLCPKEAAAVASGPPVLRGTYAPVCRHLWISSEAAQGHTPSLVVLVPDLMPRAVV